MDIKKLLKVISDLDDEEIEHSFNKTLRNFANSINGNINSEIQLNEQKISEYFESSKVNRYPPSDFDTVKFIGALEFYGLNGLSVVQGIIRGNVYNVSKTLSDLNEYIKNRETYCKVIERLRADLESINIQKLNTEENKYKVGILLPSSYTEDKIINITKELHKWDNVFKTLKELTGEDIEDTKIDFVSTGSFDFFINNAPIIGTCLAVIIEKIVKIYKNIVEIRQTRKKLSDLGIPQSEQKIIEKQEKEHFQKEIDKIVQEIIKEFAVKKIESGRLNELKIAIKGHTTYIARCLDNGITIEISPPEIIEPEQLQIEITEENKKEVEKAKMEYDKKLKEIEIIQKAMDTIKTIGGIGTEIGNLLTNGEGKDEAN